MKIITSGSGYSDIDTLACILAYKQLLDLKGESSIAFIPGILNDSVTGSIKSWNLQYETSYEIKPEDELIIMDTSDTQYLEKDLNLDQVVEVYDHHSGYEQFWKDKIGNKAFIEPVGSCTTLIWQEFQKNKLSNQISTLNANLIYTSTLSNTLNLKASITKQEDTDALNEVRKYTDLPKNWGEIYFDEVSKSTFEDPQKAMINDTKIVKIHDQDFHIIQIELWDNEKFIEDNLELIKSLLQDEKSFFTSPNISQGFNYIVTKDNDVRALLEDKIEARFEGDLGKTYKLWLRKEIVKELQ